MTSSFFSLGKAIRLFLLIGLVGVVFVFVQSCQGPSSGLDAYAKDSLKKLTLRENPPLPPNTVFETADGQEITFEALRGKTVLVNVWATWCAPCVKEMPSLDRLQALRGGDDFVVITLSIDRTQAIPAAFFVENGIENLAPYHDGTFGLPGQLRLRGYPTSILYNEAGREVAFLEGDAEWDSPAALALVDYIRGQ